MTKFKKITSLIMAAAIATSAFCCSVSAAPVEKANWSVSHNNVKYAPEPTKITCSLYMVYSTDGNTAYCNRASNSVNGGNGRVYIRCTDSNATLPTQTLTNASQSVTCKPVFSGKVYGVHYYMYAETTSYNNIFSASGTMVTE